MIKKDAKLSAEIGTLLFERLNEIFLYIVSEHNEEDFKRFKELVDSKSEINEAWMTHIQTLQILISEFEKSAIDSGQTYEVDASDEDIIRQDN